MNTERLNDVLSKKLAVGKHSTPDQGMCVMEAVAYVAGESHTDHPACASAVASAFMRAWNDSLDDKGREKLKPYISKLIGSAGDFETEQKRGLMIVSWYLTVFTPTWLELAGLSDHATALRTAVVASWGDVTRLEDKLSAAESAAWSAAWSAAESAAEKAARSAAEKAAWSAAESAAWSAAESAAEKAARSAAWSAAEKAAWSAAESAAEKAAWSAAESAAWSAAWSAAESAAEKAARSAAEKAARSAAEKAARSAAWSAARSSAEQALEPTVTRLQASALELLDRVLEVR